MVIAASAVALACSGRRDNWGGARQGPEAKIAAWPASGSTATVFSFDGSASTTSEGALEFRWDLDGDGAFEADWSTSSDTTGSFGTAGTHTATVEVRNATGAVDAASVTVEVLNAGPFTLTAPDGGEQWLAGDNEQITWTSPGGAGDVVIEISRDGGATWTVLSTVTDTGSWNWPVTGPTAADCLIRLSPDSQPDQCDQSEEAFMVYDADKSIVLDNISPVTTERWLDIAGNEYSGAFMSSFDYDDATVTIHYASSAPTFAGRVEATGLKPNFAYQVKLAGRRAWLEPFESIGFLGRWWIDIGGTNFTDAQYLANKDDPDRIIDSYIFFLHFVTDSNGDATEAFALDSSLHVIWSEELNSRSPGADDSAIYPYTFTPGGPAYPAALPQTTENLWLENEWVNPRPAIGEAVMDAGEYFARVVVTEESFHQSGVTYGGTWATVLSGDVEFTVAP